MFGERWNRILCSRGDEVALWFPGGNLTFHALHDEAEQLRPQSCAVLGQYFLAQGDGRQVATAILASLLKGLPVQVVEADRSRRVPATPPPEGTALIKQTVGSSGRRRCQFFSWSQVAADVDRLASTLALPERGVAVAAVSVAHSYGLTTTILPMLLHGVEVHWLPAPFPSIINDVISRHERVYIPAVPAIWKACLAAGFDASRVALAVSAGSPLSAELEAMSLQRLGVKLHTLYGASECGAISYDSSETLRENPASMGSLLPGVTAEKGPQERLLIRSDAVGWGYDAPGEGEVFGGGRHLTWDRVRLANGELLFEGCLGPGINVAGRKLSPEEVADRVRKSTGVDDVVIHGATSRDPERVQDVVAKVGLPPHAMTQQFKATACESLAPWEVPRRWLSSCAD
jgi:long-chain acyl-CoA synthetase